jgi:hypothetical protein
MTTYRAEIDAQGIHVHCAECAGTGAIPVGAFGDFEDLAACGACEGTGRLTADRLDEHDRRQLARLLRQALLSLAPETSTG